MLASKLSDHRFLRRQHLEEPGEQPALFGVGANN